MIKLSSNCSYKFIKDDTKVFTLCRVAKSNKTLIADENINKNLVINPLRNSYYTEPIIDRTGTVRNTLIAFTDEDFCYIWKNKFTPMSSLLQMKDKSAEDMFNDDITNISFTLQDIKAVSADLRMSLLVIIDARDVNKELNYEVFYYDAKHKQTNF